MKFIRGTLVGIALVTVLAGCGGEDSTFTHTVEPAPSPSASMAETDSCRTSVAGADGMADQADAAATDDIDGLSSLHQKVKAVATDASVHCSSHVQDPMNLAEYHLARAAARAQACQFIDYCSDAPIAKDLVAASKSLREATTASERTE